ncbi:MAG: chromophore lyase CpcT/CpeT [Thainema sp.]
MSKISGVAIALLPILFSWPVQANPDLESQADEIVSYLVGQMDTSAQAAASEETAAVQMTTCVIQVEASETGSRDGQGTYLYQEQALMAQLEQPYRQRFLQIVPHELSQSVRSHSYKPSHPAAWIGLCDRPEANRMVPAADLGESVCDVFLRPVPSGYLGKTPIGGCPADFRGAVRITNQVLLHAQGMNTWDRGFDADGNQVWGAEDTAYQFRR